MCPREAQSRDLRWPRAPSQRYSERPAVGEICEASQLHDGCNKGNINTQQDLSECWTMYHRHSYPPWDNCGTLGTIETRERTPVQEVQRGLLKQEFFRRSHWATSRSLIVQKKCPKSILIWQHMAIMKSSLWLNISEIIILQKRRRQAIFVQWPALCTRLVRQKAISPNHVFSNLLASSPDDIKDCLILLGFMLTLSPSAAKCEQGFSAMNHLKCNLPTTLGQNTLSDFMRKHSLDQTIQWKLTNWTLLSVTGFLEQGQRDTFRKWSNWLQAFPTFQQICWRCSFQEPSSS